MGIVNTGMFVLAFLQDGYIPSQKLGLFASECGAERVRAGLLPPTCEVEAGFGGDASCVCLHIDASRAFDESGLGLIRAF